MRNYEDIVTEALSDTEGNALRREVVARHGVVLLFQEAARLCQHLRLSSYPVEIVSDGESFRLQPANQISSTDGACVSFKRTGEQINIAAHNVSPAALEDARYRETTWDPSRKVSEVFGTDACRFIANAIDVLARNREMMRGVDRK